MITKIFDYPWGPRKVYYDSWQLVIDTGEERMTNTAKTEHDFLRILETFHLALKAERSKGKIIFENPQYFEYAVDGFHIDSMTGKKVPNITKCYIIGFLSDKQHE